MYKLHNLSSVTEEKYTLSDGTLVPINNYILEVYEMREENFESDQSDKGLYESVDDYGTTYYYRGNVTNNYVKFAENYWRIIRINGDESVRLLYVGPELDNTTNNIGIGVSKFNIDTNNPTYIGYMYSNTLNTTYEDTISNDNNSEIKKKIDNWYKTNILDFGYSGYIADSGFCNDRSIASDSLGNGVTSTEMTYYAARYRTLNHTPSLICPNINNDLFTLSGNSKGNGKLVYPIGMVTIDEFTMAGASSGYLNNMNYMYSLNGYWILSPNHFSSASTTSSVYFANGDGAIGSGPVNFERVVRPVINLKADTEISGGIGTKNNPFIIK